MDEKKIASSLFVGCILVGTAIGLYIRKPAFGAVLGVGVGFIVRAIYMQNKKN